MPQFIFYFEQKESSRQTCILTYRSAISTRNVDVCSIGGNPLTFKGHLNILKSYCKVGLFEIKGVNLNQSSFSF